MFVTVGHLLNGGRYHGVQFSSVQYSECSAVMNEDEDVDDRRAEVVAVHVVCVL